ncbi:MAG: hypothetical protein JW795_21395 [Chitinivibrionales bacterium]|nr:hypothetical protein [Chitinivibrionales bacterium]
MNKILLLGDEALAAAAIDAGLSVAYGYPGTPSTEIMEYIQRCARSDSTILAYWSTNEKSALEAAIGVSYAGKRSMAVMKHVGLNVSADPFVNAALLSINGGLVIAVADDPGMHSSQNEQDSRVYADFARVFCFEPRNHQQVYDMTYEAFDISQRFQIPVIVRLVTRLAHSRAAITPKNRRPQNEFCKAPNRNEWMLIPAFARKQWEKLLSKQAALIDYSQSCGYTSVLHDSTQSSLGVITAGVGCNYYLENIDEYGQKPSHLHIGTYPFPEAMIRLFVQKLQRVLCIEEGSPFVERLLRGIIPPQVVINGKMDGFLPLTGELNPDLVRTAMGCKERKGIGLSFPDLPQRPPQLCAGCPHIDTFTLIKEITVEFPEAIVTSDIGCYALGALPPYSVIETLVCMGASISMAVGVADVGGKKVIAAIGDSTFLHSGLPPLIDAVSRQAPITVVIMDNATTAMTGGQTTILGSERVVEMVKAMGVHPDHVRTIVPMKKFFTENLQILRTEVLYQGVSVIVSRRECIQTAKSPY